MSRTDGSDDGAAAVAAPDEWHHRHGRTRSGDRSGERVVEDGVDDEWRRRHAECRKGQ